MVSKVALIISLIINLVLVGYIMCYLPACSENNQKSKATASGQVASDTPLEKGMKKDRPLPEMSKIAEYRGKLVSISDADTSLLIFIALDCPGCNDVLGITGQLKPSRNIVRHLVVRNEESMETVNEFLASHDLEIPFILDRESRISDDFKIQGTPEAIVVIGSEKVELAAGYHNIKEMYARYGWGE